LSNDLRKDGVMSDWNQKIIEEFRANEGKVGGQFEGAPLLLLHHVGAKTGTERVTPLVYQPAGERYVIFASKAGAPTNPDWFHNVVANPVITIEVGSVEVPVARIAEGAERDELWGKQKDAMPGFADYEKATTRTIPVIVLEPAGAA
jgi:deazaflavin-dependent oxidoreductase (nitroreductase family)